MAAPTNILAMFIERLRSRYGAEWCAHIPSQISDYAAGIGRNINFIPISGACAEREPPPEAFFDFTATSIFKCDQGRKLFELIDAGTLNDGDVVLFFDAWNPVVIQLRLLCDVIGLNLRIIGLWHAGSYDSHDILGQRIPDKTWSLNFERAIFQACDVNAFATEYHRNLFIDSVAPNNPTKAIRASWPMEYLRSLLSPYFDLPKDNLIVFPHRLGPEKQPEIFDDLSVEFPGYEFVVCQRHNLSKSEYHDLLGRAKVVFSASLQETLGIAVYEGMLCGAMPVVPDRLSYSEIYADDWRYPTEWTESFAAYQAHKSELINFIRNRLNRFDTGEASVRAELAVDAEAIGNNFFNGEALYREVLR